MKFVDEFFIGLQFLTRLSIVKQTIWTEELFGGSVKFFPLIGAVLGIISGSIALIFFALDLPAKFLLAGILTILPTILTGGIHSDGFMDTCDGIFSGRDREKMLEIMKDSRTGSMAVSAFVCISIINFSLILDLISMQNFLIAAVFSTPIISRFMMVCTIGLFPYARKSGMGYAFAKYTTRKTIFIAMIELILLMIPSLIFLHTITILLPIILAGIFTIWFGKYAVKKLGGVTGDVYGFVLTMCESISLLGFLIGGCL